MSDSFVVAVANNATAREWRLTGDEPFAIRETVTIRKSGVSPRHFAETMNAVYRDTGRKPTHFLVGRETWLEMRQWESPYLNRRMSANGHIMCYSFDGIVAYPDPTRKSGIVACPEVEWLIGREMPKGAVWDPEVEAKQRLEAARQSFPTYESVKAAVDELKAERDRIKSLEAIRPDVNRLVAQVEAAHAEPETLEQLSERMRREAVPVVRADGVKTSVDAMTITKTLDPTRAKGWRIVAPVEGASAEPAYTRLFEEQMAKATQDMYRQMTEAHLKPLSWQTPKTTDDSYEFRMSGYFQLPKPNPYPILGPFNCGVGSEEPLRPQTKPETLEEYGKRMAAGG